MSFKIPLTILFEMIPDTPVIAHCLEMDLVVDAPTLERAKSDIIDVVRTQLDYAMEHGISPFDPAPKEFWDRLQYAIPLEPETSCEDLFETSEGQYPFVYVLEADKGATYTP